jgi:hypothetical protein
LLNPSLLCSASINSNFNPTWCWLTGKSLKHQIDSIKVRLEEKDEMRRTRRGGTRCASVWTFCILPSRYPDPSFDSGTCHI